MCLQFSFSAQVIHWYYTYEGVESKIREYKTEKNVLMFSLFMNRENANFRLVT